MEDIDKVLAALGLKLVNVIAGAAVSFASLRFFDNLSVIDKWTTFVGGWAFAAWGAAPLREYLEVKASLEIGFVILIGFFGMALGSELIKVVKSTDWNAIFKSIYGRFLGNKGEK
jgi:hypothetical protein